MIHVETRWYFPLFGGKISWVVWPVRNLFFCFWKLKSLGFASFSQRCLIHFEIWAIFFSCFCWFHDSLVFFWKPKLPSIYLFVVGGMNNFRNNAFIPGEILHQRIFWVISDGNQIFACEVFTFKIESSVLRSVKNWFGNSNFEKLRNHWIVHWKKWKFTEF